MRHHVDWSNSSNVFEKPAATKVREIHTSVLNMEGTGVNVVGGGKCCAIFFPPMTFFLLATELKGGI